MRLLSVIIPCYNAERWVAEAVDSCLRQTYLNVEVIVVDDGSTDRSLEILRAYGKRIKLEVGPNRGGNCARNVGFALSRGDYIQYLDADDYLLPEKMEIQVACLESTGADIVYSDWRHLVSGQDGSHRLEPVEVSGRQSDVLAALLSGWWVACMALLIRRSVIEKLAGWDESLKAAQDRDFFTRAALTSAKIEYLPGCHSIYRRYGSISVSTGNRQRWAESHCRVLDKATAALEANQRLSPEYRHALARSYFGLARNYFDLDREKYYELMAKVLTLEPAFRPLESRLYNMFRHCLGFYAAERLASWRRRLVHRRKVYAAP